MICDGCDAKSKRWFSAARGYRALVFIFPWRNNCSSGKRQAGKDEREKKRRKAKDKKAADVDQNTAFTKAELAEIKKTFRDNVCAPPAFVDEREDGIGAVRLLRGRSAVFSLLEIARACFMIFLLTYRTVDMLARNLRSSRLLS
jgi:hypothetical protein